MAQVETPNSASPTKRPSPVRIKKLGHVVFHVSDVERSIPFYTEVLNFRVADRLPNGSAFLTAVGDHHTIALFPAGDGAAARLPTEGSIRLNHFALQIGSLEELFEIRAYLQERGVPIVQEGRRGLGGHTSIQLVDPDGYHIELYVDMDQVGPDQRSRPRDPNANYDSLEASRDHPKPPTW
jgi:catechol 2,3-dioxygenase-like lactoylglutathione lyase family enzyme